jgi:hypothetical protein
VLATTIRGKGGGRGTDDENFLGLDDAAVEGVLRLELGDALLEPRQLASAVVVAMAVGPPIIAAVVAALHVLRLGRLALVVRRLAVLGRSFSCRK